MAGQGVNFTVSVVDDDEAIPAPHSSRARYRPIVAAVMADGQRRVLHCKDRADAKAVYAGIRRAIEFHRAATKITTFTRTLEDGTVSVVVERG